MGWDSSRRRAQVRALLRGLALVGGVGSVFLLTTADASAQSTSAGLYVDEAHERICLVAPPETTFTAILWAHAPSSGFVYLTLRFAFPPQLAFASRARFADSVDDVIVTEFVDGTVEWNIFFDGCPAGWVRVFEQDFEVLDATPARIEIVRAVSLVRDCEFELRELGQATALALNGPDCTFVARVAEPWSTLKMRYQ